MFNVSDNQITVNSNPNIFKIFLICTMRLNPSRFSKIFSPDLQLLGQSPADFSNRISPSATHMAIQKTDSIFFNHTSYQGKQFQERTSCTLGWERYGWCRVECSRYFPYVSQQPCPCTICYSTYVYIYVCCCIGMGWCGSGRQLIPKPCVMAILCVVHSRNGCKVDRHRDSICDRVRPAVRYLDVIFKAIFNMRLVPCLTRGSVFNRSPYRNMDASAILRLRLDLV